MNALIKIIKEKDWESILDYTKKFTDKERYLTIETLMAVDINKDILGVNDYLPASEDHREFYNKRSKIDNNLKFALVSCTRNYNDIKMLRAKGTGWVDDKFQESLSDFNAAAFVAFYSLFPPDYFNQVIIDLAKERFRNIGFQLLWLLHEHEWVDFDEAFFIRSLMTVNMFDRSTQSDADFLAEHPKAIKDVLLQFYKYELPILDISKWQSTTGYQCKKVCEYWTEVFVLLQEKKINFDRSIIDHLLESLLNNWKKPHLDWHVRILDLFKPTPKEYLENQAILFAILGTGQTSLINYSIKNISIICCDESFNQESFVANFPFVFSNVKNVKAILTGLNILDSISPETFISIPDYNEQLAVLLMLPDDKLQEKAAQFLLKHFNTETLSETVRPYVTYLKQKAKAILSINENKNESVVDHINAVKQPYKKVTIPSTWDELLFHIGNCLRTKSAIDIDLFYEGLNQLQEEIPEDFEKQLRPYTNQLFNKYGHNSVIETFTLFLRCWIDESNIDIEADEYDPIPFLKRKSQWLLDNLKIKNSLPFLSTPSQEPFFVHPDVLLERLFIYESKNEPVELEDLIVACNRTLLHEVNDNTIQNVKKLKGNYKAALQYYFGATNKLKITDDMLPVWTQITRIKEPNETFTAFEMTTAKDYPSVIKPFFIDFSVKTDTNQYASWERLIVGKNWNNSRSSRQGKAPRQDALYYNTASVPVALRESIAFQLSLNPWYLDSLLCRYLPTVASGNEVYEIEHCLYPLQFVVANDLPVYHSGWLYIAVCLLFEKKISRELAAVYVQKSIGRDSNLDHLIMIIARLIASKFAPVNRLIGYLDKPYQAQKVKHFQWCILKQCILDLDEKKLPINSKKLVSYLHEWSLNLKMDISADVQQKILQLKK